MSKKYFAFHTQVLLCLVLVNHIVGIRGNGKKLQVQKCSFRKRIKTPSIRSRHIYRHI